MRYASRSNLGSLGSEMTAKITRLVQRFEQTSRLMLNPTFVFPIRMQAQYSRHTTYSPPSEKFLTIVGFQTTIRAKRRQTHQHPPSHPSASSSSPTPPLLLLLSSPDFQIPCRHAPFLFWPLGRLGDRSRNRHQRRGRRNGGPARAL